MKKTLSIQIHHPQDEGCQLAIEHLLSLLKATSLVESIDIDADATSDYTNINMVSSDLNGLWVAISSFMSANSVASKKISDRWIVVCEGNHGWDDYLTLAHYDLANRLDSL